MANTHTLRGLFKDIANKIRALDGTSAPIPATEFPERILTMGDLFVALQTDAATDIKASRLNGVTTISAYAFSGCSNLTSIELPSTISSIDKNAFYACDNLTTIKVPWAEGVKQNAPWGATNATIIYNYGG